MKDKPPIHLVKGSKPEDWYRHDNVELFSNSSGGWVHYYASVGEKVFIDRRAVVYGNAVVGAYADILGNSKIHGNACIASYVQVKNAEVKGKAVIRTSIENGVWTKTPFYVDNIGVFRVDLVSPTHLMIGCQKHSIEWWLKHYERMGKKYELDSKQIKAYKRVIDRATKAAAKVQEQWKKSTLTNS